jgi:AcrR family transcriptional regulator
VRVGRGTRGEIGVVTDRRQLHKDRTSAAIVDAALALFSDLGFDATTVEQIAAKAEVSPVTVFRYFGSKDGILFATLDDETDRLRDIVRSRAPSTDPRPIVIDALLLFAREMPAEQRQYAQRSKIISGSATLQRASLATRVAFENALAEEVARLSPHGDGGLAVRTTAAAGLTALHMALRSWRDEAANGAALEDYVRPALAALWPDLL